MKYIAFYTSADGPETGSTWSVCREEFRYDANDYPFDQPIEGSQAYVSTHSDESTADHEACRLAEEANA